MSHVITKSKSKYAIHLNVINIMSEGLTNLYISTRKIIAINFIFQPEVLRDMIILQSTVKEEFDPQ